MPLGTAVDIVYEGVGPGGNNQILCWGDGRGVEAQRLVGSATFTGDGTNQVGTINYVPGTNGAGQLSFTPTTVVAIRSGGNETNNAVGIANTVDSATNNTNCTVTFTNVPTSAKTFKVAVFINP